MKTEEISWNAFRLRHPYNTVPMEPIDLSVPMEPIDLSFMGLSPVSSDDVASDDTDIDLSFLDDLSDDESDWFGHAIEQTEPTLLMSDDAPLCVQMPGERKTSQCFCKSDTCQRKYGRVPSHPRVLEQSSQLVRVIGGVEVKNCQLTIPDKLQQFINYGSCCHIFDSLKLFLKYIQLELGWFPREDGYRFKLPSAADYTRAKEVLLALGLGKDFYVYEWVPTFHDRFVTACGGLRLVQTVATRFLTEPDLHLLYDSVQYAPNVSRVC